ncbi:2-hydroxychromene-2-carboxylate isomerase [Noviherbaspirillum suwonense]|uniref:2-hydroxychromene-2-carboxylate isomerase n=1 Tax=Noviherbaspirillum suwonense TaxID=1224511 RepID=A0ABY1PQZ5_9BURK|nr:2-hydroxychromene-2-carboxylate isomerase [Noviherbaspirillum suwonense]SMP42793.1 2-hydroxychromene-2-carboxylate isomerase [Noviherbaspirillum suwonense]
MTKSCTYYLAPQSPYVYLGHQRFTAMTQQHGVDIDIRPCDIGRVFGTSGGLPLPKRAPQRQAYRLLELERWSRFLGLPLNLHPAFFPVDGDPAARLIIAAKLAEGNDAAMRLTGAVGRAVWVEERNIADAGTLSAIAAETGLDGAALVDSADSAAVRAEYDRYTDDAIAANVFGAPWYIVDGVGYWGQDRLDFVERALQQA